MREGGASPSPVPALPAQAAGSFQALQQLGRLIVFSRLAVAAFRAPAQVVRIQQLAAAARAIGIRAGCRWFRDPGSNRRRPGHYATCRRSGGRSRRVSTRRRCGRGWARRPRLRAPSPHPIAKALRRLLHLARGGAIRWCPQSARYCIALPVSDDLSWRHAN